MGAAVLIFCNKCDLEGALPVEKIQEVASSSFCWLTSIFNWAVQSSKRGTGPLYHAVQ